MKDIAMIIQMSNLPLNQAMRPDTRAHDAAPVKTVADTPKTEPQHVSVEELKSTVAAINQVMQQTNLNLQFSVDTDTQQTVVRMVDTSTGEMIRQFPSEAILAISRGIEQFQQGLLFTQKA